MNLFLDAFWRALAYSLRPRVIALSFLPLLLLGALSLLMFWLCWDAVVQFMQARLDEWTLLESLLRWLESAGLGHLRSVLAPLLLLLLALPAMIVLSLLAVAWFVTPAIVRLVAQRRFPALVGKQGGTFLGGVVLSLVAVLLAVLALLVSMPLWLIPPLVLVLPPLIWGWLTARVMVYDTLAQHASREERLALMHRHRFWWLAIGVAASYLGAAPGMLWAFGAMAVVFAPLLVPLAIWVYTFVFIFSSLWFAHFGLSALATLRAELEQPVATLLPAEAGRTFHE